MAYNLNQFYKESGAASPINISLVFLFSLIFVLSFSYLYSLLVTYLPIVYFNILIVVAFGFSISFISRFFNLIFKIRNRRKSIIITIILSLFAVYFQWSSYFYIISSENLNIFNNLNYFLEILSRPDLLVLNMIEINKIGAWEIGSITFTGFILWLIWFAEAGIIIFLAFNNYSNFGLIPFSEKDNKWYKKEYLDFDFEHIPFKKKFVEALEINAYDAISKLKKGNGLRHSKLSIYNSDTELKSLITIDNIIIAERGKGKKDITPVLLHYYVDNQHLKQIKENYRTKKSSLFEI